MVADAQVPTRPPDDGSAAAATSLTLTAGITVPPTHRASLNTQVLSAEASERAGEPARLKEPIASTRPRTAEQQRQVPRALDETARQLNGTRAAQGGAAAASPSPRPCKAIRSSPNRSSRRGRHPSPGLPRQPGRIQMIFLRAVRTRSRISLGAGGQSCWV